MKTYKEKRREWLQDEINQTEIHNSGYLFTRDTLNTIFTCVGVVVVSKWAANKVVNLVEKRKAKRLENGLQVKETTEDEFEEIVF